MLSGNFHFAIFRSLLEFHRSRDLLVVVVSDIVAFVRDVHTKKPNQKCIAEAKKIRPFLNAQASDSANSFFTGAEYNDPLRFIRPISKTNDVYKFWLSVALLEYYWREIRKIHSRMSVIRARDLNLAHGFFNDNLVYELF